jgi:hypothetical protein
LVLVELADLLLQLQIMVLMDHLLYSIQLHLLVVEQVVDICQ